MRADESCYKCFVGKGNNSALVKQVLASRWWWTCVDESHLPNVNLVWTQSTSLEYLKTITMTKYKPEEPVFDCRRTLQCPVLFETETLERVNVDLSPLGYDLISQSDSYLAFKDLKNHSSSFYRTHNKLEMNQVLTDKKNLCKVMQRFYKIIEKTPCIPLTFEMNSQDSQEFQDFKNIHENLVALDKNPLWIVKPGENSNRGNGIFVTDDIWKICETLKSGSSFIVQRYIDRPFLINKRKFDIRLYSLVTSVNGVFQCYYYREGYLRTSCKEFSLKNLSNSLIHLTNDAIQKHADDYGKFENGNKLSYSDFQRYLDSHISSRHFFNEILPEIKEIVKDTVKAAFLDLDSNRRCHSFEVLGYDFMLDAELKPWLIEVNTNPCLELSSSILVRIIPAMLENVARIALDPVFPEPINIPKRMQGGFVQEMIPENKFELIFHEQVDGKEISEKFKLDGKLRD
jgi:tubulin polyglutamylase TTLL1/tubulin monoglycylase TTLL3/8